MAALTIGYAAMLEQFGPQEVVGYQVLAEQNGFSGCMAADHFQPWVPQQGQAAFVWNVLTALGESLNHWDEVTRVEAALRVVQLTRKGAGPDPVPAALLAKVLIEALKTEATPARQEARTAAGQGTIRVDGGVLRARVGGPVPGCRRLPTDTRCYQRYRGWPASGHRARAGKRASG